MYIKGISFFKIIAKGVRTIHCLQSTETMNGLFRKQESCSNLIQRCATRVEHLSEDLFSKIIAEL